MRYRPEMSVQNTRRLITRFTLTSALAVSALVGASTTPAAAAPFEPLDSPQRIVDTRPNGQTVDNEFEGLDTFGPDEIIEVEVAGRAGVPDDALGVVLNVTAVNAASGGFFTVYPCTDEVPNASNLNYRAGQNIANTVFASLDADGNTCVFTSAESNVIIDVSGTLPADAFIALPEPRRLADTRPQGDTFDGDVEGQGRQSAATFLKIPVRDRAGVPADAETAVLNVTTTNSQSNGFFTVYPCGDVPTASNLNYLEGQIIANAVVSKLDDDGDVCVFTSAASNVIIDVAGTLAPDAFVSLPEPRRLADTRLTGETFPEESGNSIYEAIGTRNGGETLSLDVAGRAGVPLDASSVVLNVTSVRPITKGFLTVHPRGTDRPNASNLNYDANQNIANAVVTRIGGDGHVCIFNSEATGVIVDVAGYLTGPTPDIGGPSCPDNEQRLDTGLSFDPDIYDVNSEIPPGRYEIANAPAECGFARFDAPASLANRIGTNVGTAPGSRLLVDVRPTDVQFGITDECSNLRPYEKSTARARGMGPGNYVIGDHIVAGTYVADVDVDCAVGVTESFDGSEGSIVAASVVDEGDSRQAEITLLATDTGFYSSVECGTWTLVDENALTDRAALTDVDVLLDRSAEPEISESPAIMFP